MSSSSTFTQSAGTLTNSGSFTVTNGTFTQSGGTDSGNAISITAAQPWLTALAGAASTCSVATPSRERSLPDRRSWQ